MVSDGSWLAPSSWFRSSTTKGVSMKTISEVRAWGVSGFLALSSIVALFALAGILLFRGIRLAEVNSNGAAWMIVGSSLIIVVAAVCMNGFFVVQPNESRVLTFVGRYVGS